MTQRRPCVLIYNPISGHGHLDSWNALFAGVLLKRGFRVLELTPDRRALELRLQNIEESYRSRLHILSWNIEWDWVNFRLTLRRLWHWWLTYGQLYATDDPATFISDSMPALIRAKKRVFKVIVPRLYRLTRALYGQNQVEEKRCNQFLSEVNHLDPIEMGLRIKTAIKRSPWTPDYLFNMYLDMFKTDADSWKTFGFICSIPWGGIRFVPRDAASPEGYYVLTSLRGVCFLNEAVTEKHRERITNKVFEYLPDVTYTGLPSAPCQMVQEITRRASGRRIVFLGGSIGGPKNIARWCELISLADPQRWFFVQIGEIHEETFSLEERSARMKLSSSPPENLYLHTKYVEDEKEFNSVVQAADVLFLVYRNFPISSNMLSKAAFLRKPVIASSGVFIGHEVERFKIGLAVPEQDASAILSAIENVVGNPPSDDCYDNLLRHNSQDKLADNLERFIRDCLESDDRAA